MELPLAGRSPEDRPYDGGVCLALLPVQPWSVPVDRSEPQLTVLSGVSCQTSSVTSCQASTRTKTKVEECWRCSLFGFIVLLSKNVEESTNNPGRAIFVSDNQILAFGCPTDLSSPRSVRFMSSVKINGGKKMCVMLLKTFNQ